MATQHLNNYVKATKMLHRLRGVTIQELEDELEITERSVFKLITDLESMGFFINRKKDPENPKRYRYTIDTEYDQNLILPEISFSENEKAVFNYLMDKTSDTPALEEDALKLFSKLSMLSSIRGTLLEIGYNKPIPIINALAIRKLVNNRDSSKLCSMLLDIIAEKKWMEVKYKSMQNPQGRRWPYVFPLILFVSEGDTYVYGLTKHGDLRMFALERIMEIARVFDAPEPKHDINFKELLSDPFGIVLDHEPFDVKLHITEPEASFLKQKKWPDQVHITDNEDGSIIFEVRTRCSYFCKRWIMEKTPFVKVLEPQWIKDEIRQTLQQALETLF